MQLIAFQAQPPFQKEGLPYWLFWFLLCIILLLLAFIFLRNKQLRMRLSYFLAGARRRSLLLQLKFNLKKERQKRENLLRQIGERAWDEDIQISGGEHIRAELKALQEKRNAGQLAWKKAYSELERLHQELEKSILLHQAKTQEEKSGKSPLDELMKRKNQEEGALKKALKGMEQERLVDEIKREKEEIQEKIDEFEHRIKETQSEGKKERHMIEREIHHWERGKKRLQERIKSIEAEQVEHYISLGRLVEYSRVEILGIDILYTQIEAVNHRIATLQHRVEILSGSS